MVSFKVSHEISFEDISAVLITESIPVARTFWILNNAIIAELTDPNTLIHVNRNLYITRLTPGY